MVRFTLFLCLSLPCAILGSLFQRPGFYPMAKSIVGPSLDYIEQLPLQAAPQYYQFAASKYGRAQQTSEQVSNEEEIQPQFETKMLRQQENSDFDDTLAELAGYRYLRYADPPPQDQQRRSFRSKAWSPKSNKHANPITWRGLAMAAGPNGLVQEERDIEKLYDDAYKSIKRVDDETKKNFHKSYNAAIEAEQEDVQLNATDLMKEHGYTVEEHVVKTDDGYHLTLFRIPPQQRRPRTQKSEVVFLMHGILGSADDWLIMGPGKSLAYLLADAGYDVYLGNARGNKYCRRHASKHPAQEDFWKFSGDEIALHDLPAMIDYALRTSEQEKLYYVGHSQGTISFFALAASRPEYNDKVKMMFALAPLAFMGHARSPFMKMIAPHSDTYEKMIERLGSGEFRPQPELMHYAGGELCEKAIGCRKVCSNALFAITGINADQLDMSTVPAIMAHSPAGSSMRLMKHYGQAVASHDLRRYDFGAEVNEKVYGSRVPPSYNLEDVRVPVALYYSQNDWLAHPKDVTLLRNKLGNVTDFYLVPEEYFGHMDFQYSKNALEYIYKRLINAMQEQRISY